MAVLSARSQHGDGNSRLPQMLAAVVHLQHISQRGATPPVQLPALPAKTEVRSCLSSLMWRQECTCTQCLQLVSAGQQCLCCSCQFLPPSARLPSHQQLSLLSDVLKYATAWTSRMGRYAVCAAVCAAQ